MPRLQSSVSRTGGGVYRHRLGLAPGYAAYDEIERRLGDQSPITVPTIVLDGQADGNVPATDGTPSAAHFTGPHTHRQVPNAGHNLPQEHPEAFAYAVLELARIRARLRLMLPVVHRKRAVACTVRFHGQRTHCASRHLPCKNPANPTTRQYPPYRAPAGTQQDATSRPYVGRMLASRCGSRCRWVVPSSC